MVITMLLIIEIVKGAAEIEFYCFVKLILLMLILLMLMLILVEVVMLMIIGRVKRVGGGS